MSPPMGFTVPTGEHQLTTSGVDGEEAKAALGILPMRAVGSGVGAGVAGRGQSKRCPGLTPIPVPAPADTPTCVRSTLTSLRVRGCRSAPEQSARGAGLPNRCRDRSVWLRTTSVELYGPAPP